MSSVLTAGHQVKAQSRAPRSDKPTHHPIVINTVIIELAGVAAATIFGQILYWFLPSKTGQSRLGWTLEGIPVLIKSYREFAEELKMTQRQVQYAIERLEALGLIRVTRALSRGSLTNHIRFPAPWEIADPPSPPASPVGEPAGTRPVSRKIVSLTAFRRDKITAAARAETPAKTVRPSNIFANCMLHTSELHATQMRVLYQSIPQESVQSFPLPPQSGGGTKGSHREKWEQKGRQAVERIRGIISKVMTDIHPDSRPPLSCQPPQSSAPAGGESGTIVSRAPSVGRAPDTTVLHPSPFPTPPAPQPQGGESVGAAENHPVRGKPDTCTDLHPAGGYPSTDRGKLTLRQNGTNPRAVGTNPRAVVKSQIQDKRENGWKQAFAEPVFETKEKHLLSRLTAQYRPGITEAEIAKIFETERG